MRKLFGDWESLLELVKNELGADQTFLSTVYDELGICENSTRLIKYLFFKLLY